MYNLTDLLKVPNWLSMLSMNYTWAMVHMYVSNEFILYVRMYVCTYICTCVCMYVWMVLDVLDYICIYMLLCTSTEKKWGSSVDQFNACLLACVLLSQLPKSKDTSAMSGAGVMRLFKNVGDAVKSVAMKRSETDQVSTTSTSSWISVGDHSTTYVANALLL